VRVDDGFDEKLARFGERQFVGEIDFVNFARGILIGPADANFAIDAAGAENRRVDEIGAIGRENDDDVLQRFDAVHFGAEHWDERGEDVAAHADGLARAEDRLGFVDEKKGQMAFSGFFAALGEKIADLALGFAEPHIQNLRTLHVEEEFRMILAGFFADLQPQIMRGGFSEQRFAATRRPEEQETFRHRMIKALEKLGVKERQFDGIANGLHGFLLAADAGPGERFDARKGAIEALGSTDDFDCNPLIGIESQIEAGFQFFLGQERRTYDDRIRNACFISYSETAV